MIFLFMQGWVKWRSGSPFGCGRHSESQRHAYKSREKKPLMGCFPARRCESVHAYKSQIKVIAHWSLATSTAAPWGYFWVLVYNSEMILWDVGGLTVIWARNSSGLVRLGSSRVAEKNEQDFFFLLFAVMGKVLPFNI